MVCVCVCMGQCDGVCKGGRHLLLPRLLPHIETGPALPDYHTRARAHTHKLTPLAPSTSNSPLTRSWVEWLEDWMGERWNSTHDMMPGQDPGKVHVTNGAVPGRWCACVRARVCVCVCVCVCH